MQTLTPGGFVIGSSDALHSNSGFRTYISQQLTGLLQIP